MALWMEYETLPMTFYGNAHSILGFHQWWNKWNSACESDIHICTFKLLTVINFHANYIFVYTIRTLIQSLKGKFPQTTMWIGWVESNYFRNPSVKVWADLDNPFKRSDYAKLCMSPLWMELCQNMWYHNRTTLQWLFTYM